MKRLILLFLAALTISAAHGQNVQGNQLTIKGPATITGSLTHSKSTIADRPSMASAGAGLLTIDVTQKNQTGSISQATTLSLSATPSTGSRFGFELTADGTARVVTLPAGTWYNETLGVITAFTVPANQTAFLGVDYTGSRYNIFGNPYTYLDFTSNTTPASTAVILTQNATTGVLERSTRAQIQADLGTPTTLVLTGATGLPLTTGVTGVLPIANGGTAGATAAAALDSLITAEATVASNTTTDLGAVTSRNVSITGTTTITSFGTATAGIMRWGRFTGILTLTHNATSLILPNGGSNKTTAANDRFAAVSLGSGNWLVYMYQPASGSGGSGTPGGSDTQVQFNDAGSFGGDSGLVFNKTTDTTSTVNLAVSTAAGLPPLYSSDGVTRLNVPYTVYATGTAYSLTATSAALDFGTTDPVRVISSPGTYLIHAQVNLKYTGATFAANRDVTLKLRRTNNTAADVTGSSTVTVTGVVTTLTNTFVVVSLPPIIYSTSNSDDSLTIFGDVAVLPSAGSLDATEASIVATRLYQ